MEYGILIAVADNGTFQIVGAVDSRTEAQVMADGYLSSGADGDCLAPDHFEIHRRGQWGWYTRRELLY